jgi:hypothetical protein
VKTLAIAVGLLIAALGLAGVVAPQILETISNAFMSESGLIAAAIIRIALGLVLMLAARGSRSPAFLRALGLFAVVAGVITFFLGVERAHQIQLWWLAQGPILIRLFPALALVFGLLIVLAVIPRRQSA